MTTRNKNIPLHRLREMTDQGFQVEKITIDNEEAKKAIAMDVHRDDHYIFLLQHTGRSRVMIDFSEYVVKGRNVLIILPGQVHRYLSSDLNTIGWFVALDIELVPELFRAVLEDPLMVQGPLKVADAEISPIDQCLELAHTASRRPAGNFSKQVILGLLTSFVAMMTAVYSASYEGSTEQVPRPRMLTQEFRKLLSIRYKELKSPGKYAAELNISLSYLNEVVKATTGFSVSYWIRQEVVLEAKRLLYHSGCSVKEIAHLLGYEDHAYFSRLFSKTVGSTPGAFRRHYRE